MPDFQESTEFYHPADCKVTIVWSVGGTAWLQVICSPKSVGLAFDKLFMYLLSVFLP